IVSDSGGAPRQDVNLIDPIGLDAIGRMFVAENGTSQFTSLSDGLQVIVPSPSGGTSKPTGLVEIPAAGSTNHAFFFTNVVFTTNSSNPTNVVVNQRTFRGPAKVIIVTEDGTIAAWNPNVSHDAVILVDNSSSGAVYKGVTIAKNS